MKQGLPLPLQRLLCGVLILVGLTARPASADRQKGATERAIRLERTRLDPAFLRDVLSVPELDYGKGAGISLHSPKGSVSLSLGWEGQFDAVWYGGMDEEVEEAAHATWDSGLSVRRSRLYVEGRFGGAWYFRARYSFDFRTTPQFEDFFVEWSGLHDANTTWWPWIRVGQVKEDASLEQLVSVKWLLMAEPAACTVALAPGRSPGVRFAAFAPDERLTYALGFYAINVANLSEIHEEEGQALTGRVTFLPWDPTHHDGRVLHLGLWSSLRLDIQQFRAQARAETHLGPFLVDTGEFEADARLAWGGEIFYLNGPFHVQAEGVANVVRTPEMGNVFYHGGYVQAGAFVGEGRRVYNRTVGVFGRPLVETSPFEREHDGPGALEVGARLSWLDLDSGALSGGRMLNATLGLNWWTRNNVRFTFNYIFSLVRDTYGVAGANGSLNTLLFRVQLYF